MNLIVTSQSPGPFLSTWDRPLEGKFIRTPFRQTAQMLILSLLALLLVFPSGARMACGEQDHLKHHCKKMYAEEERHLSTKEVLDRKGHNVLF